MNSDVISKDRVHHFTEQSEQFANIRCIVLIVGIIVRIVRITLCTARAGFFIAAAFFTGCGNKAPETPDEPTTGMPAPMAPLSEEDFTALYTDAADIMLSFIADMRDTLGFTAKILNLGGGFGVRYVESDPEITQTVRS